MTPGFLSIKTKHLTLRPFAAEDAATLCRIYRSEGVLQYFPNPAPPSLEKVKRFITGQQLHWETHGYGNWGIVLENSAEIVGWAGLQFLPELDETEVGFLLDRPFWGQGYATEAASASLRFGFNQLHLEHIIALVHPNNLASRHVIEKCGMGYRESIPLWGIELMRFYIDRHDFEMKEIDRSLDDSTRYAPA